MQSPPASPGLSWPTLAIIAPVHDRPGSRLGPWWLLWVQSPPPSHERASTLGVSVVDMEMLLRTPHKGRVCLAAVSPETATESSHPSNGMSIQWLVEAQGIRAWPALTGPGAGLGRSTAAFLPTMPPSPPFPWVTPGPLPQTSPHPGVSRVYSLENPTRPL